MAKDLTLSFNVHRFINGLLKRKIKKLKNKFSTIEEGV